MSNVTEWCRLVEKCLLLNYTEAGPMVQTVTKLSATGVRCCGGSYAAGPSTVSVLGRWLT